MYDQQEETTARKRVKDNQQKYPINIHFIKDSDGEPYVFAYLPDFGHSACSATGETVVEALATLALVQEAVIEHYQERGKPVPTPSKSPWEDELK